MSPENKIPKAKLVTVKKCIDAWLQTSGLKRSHIYASEGLSERNVGRILNGENYDGETEWIDDVNVIYLRLHALAEECNKKRPTTWLTFFNRELTLPTVRLDAALYNKAELDSDELKARVEPLLYLLESQAKIASDQENVWKAGSLLNYVCDLAELIGDWTKAEIYLHQLAALNRSTGDFHFAANAYLRRGQALMQLGQAERALLAFENGIRVIKDAKDRTPPHRIHLRLLSSTAVAKLELGDAQEAKRILYNEALPLARKECSPPAVASVHNRIAHVEFKRGNHLAATDHLFSALEIRLGSRMRSEVARSLAILARIHEAKNELIQAVFIGELSLHLQQALDDHETLPQIHYFLGETYAKLGERARASGKEKLILRFTPSWYPDLVQAEHIKKACEMAGMDTIERRSEDFRAVAIMNFKNCVFLERNTDAKRFPDAEGRVLQLVNERRGVVS